MVPSTGMTGAVTDRLPGAPKFTSTIAAQYQAPIGGGYTGYANIKTEMIGKSQLAIGTLPMSSVPAYSVTNLRVGVFDAHWRLSAYVTNLANTKSSTYAFGNPFSLGRMQQAIPVRPLTVGMTASWTR